MTLFTNLRKDFFEGARELLFQQIALINKYILYLLLMQSCHGTFLIKNRSEWRNLNFSKSVSGTLSFINSFTAPLVSSSSWSPTFFLLVIIFFFKSVGVISEGIFNLVQSKPNQTNFYFLLKSWGAVLLFIFLRMGSIIENTFLDYPTFILAFLIIRCCILDTFRQKACKQVICNTIQDQ